MIYDETKIVDGISFRICSLDLKGWTVEFDVGIPTMCMGSTPREAISKAIEQLKIQLGKQ